MKKSHLDICISPGGIFLFGVYFLGCHFDILSVIDECV